MLRLLRPAALSLLLASLSPLSVVAMAHHAARGHVRPDHGARRSAGRKPTGHAAARSARDAARSAARHAGKSPEFSRVHNQVGTRTHRSHGGATREPQQRASSRKDTGSERLAVARASADALRSEEVASQRNQYGNPGPRQATSEDFLAAARANRPSPRRAHDDDVKPRPIASSHTQIMDPIAKPTPVVNIIRPAAQRPQLPTIAQSVEEPLLLPTLFDTRGHLVMPRPLRGSREILLHQNQVASDDGLGRVQDDADLESMRRRGMLVGVPANAALHVDDRLPENRRVCRPWTAQFLATLARAHYARFHTPLQLTSAVRTVSFQQHLLHINGNAAPADGDTASPHLTGQAIDLGKRGLSLTEIAWLRGYLLPLIEGGKIDVEEEFRQSCFHISVYRQYSPGTETERYTVASRGVTPALAATLPAVTGTQPGFSTAGTR